MLLTPERLFVDDALREQLDHGENFSQILHGAQLLYNLMLAERAGWTEKISEYRGLLAGWWQAVQARQEELRQWDRPRFWQIVYRGNPHCGGQGVYTRYLARELTDLGHEITVFSGPPYPELDDPSQLAKVPSLDLYKPENPFRVPWPSEFKTRIDVQ